MRNLKNKKCVVCGSNFKNSSPWAKYCCYECEYKSRNLRNEKPTHKQWTYLVEFVNERDNYLCQDCREDKRLYVHHIKPLYAGGTNNDDNLISLCSLCHIRRHKELDKLICKN